jgi:hypothetical protein
MAAPTPAPAPVAARSPSLDLEAIERMVPIDVDISRFDGRRRQRRNVTLFVVLLLAVFGGLGALLAQSYAPHHSELEGVSRPSTRIADLGGGPRLSRA